MGPGAACAQCLERHCASAVGPQAKESPNAAGMGTLATLGQRAGGRTSRDRIVGDLLSFFSFGSHLCMYDTSIPSVFWLMRLLLSSEMHTPDMKY